MQWLLASLIVSSFLFQLAAPAAAQDPTADELKCEAAVSQASGKLIHALTTCARKCRRANPSGPCDVTQDDGCTEVQASKYVKTEVSKCAADCPESYPLGCSEMSFGPTFHAQGLRSNVAGSLTFAFCDDTGSPDGLTSLEQDCQHGLAKAGGKLSKFLTKCAAKCQLASLKGKTNGDCGGTGATDTKTVDCRAKALAKATDSIQQACYDPGTNAPECFAAPNAAAWATAIAFRTDGQYALTFSEPPCGGLFRIGPGCWTIGALDKSCDEVCTSHQAGSTVDPVTWDYAGAGSEGTDARCKAVLSIWALFEDVPNLPFVSTSCGVADECIVAEAGGNVQWARCTDQPPDSSAHNPVHRRACACLDP